MAVFPDRIVLKNSSDAEVDIFAAISTGGPDAITQGEIVLGVDANEVKLYTKSANGNIVTIGGSAMASGATTLAALNDVDISTTPPTDAQVLQYDGVNGIWKNASLSTTLGGLSDVDFDTAAPTDGQIVAYNSTSGNWEPVNRSFAGLADVQISDSTGASIYKLDPLPGFGGGSGRVVFQPNSASAYEFAGLSSYTGGNVSLVGGSSSSSRSVITLTSGEEVYFHPDAPGTNGAPANDWTIKIETNGTAGQRALYRDFPTLGTDETDLVIPTMGQVRSHVAQEAASELGDLSDVDLLTVAPSQGQVIAYNSFTGKWEPADGGVGGGGGGGSSAGTYLVETQTALNGVADYQGLGFSGIIHKVSSDLDAWVVLYSSSAERAADLSRAYNTDPTPGSGVLFEAYVTAGGTVVATPGTTYLNNDATVTETLYASVRDQSGGDVDAEVTFYAYGMTFITSVSGGTYGSG